LLPETRGLSLEVRTVCRLGIDCCSSHFIVQDMDILFGAVTAENRRRDRLVVQNNLMGEVYNASSHENGLKLRSMYPMQDQSVKADSEPSIQPSGESLEKYQ